MSPGRSRCGSTADSSSSTRRRRKKLPRTGPGITRGSRGTLQFNFVHRFGVSSAPLRKVSNSPTFLLSYQLPLPLLIGFNYATSSDIGGAAFPNEWEVFGRYARHGMALQTGYNQAAASADAELTAARTVGRLRLMAVGRLFSNG